MDNLHLAKHLSQKLVADLLINRLNDLDFVSRDTKAIASWCSTVVAIIVVAVVRTR